MFIILRYQVKYFKITDNVRHSLKCSKHLPDANLKLTIINNDNLLSTTYTLFHTFLWSKSVFGFLF